MTFPERFWSKFLNVLDLADGHRWCSLRSHVFLDPKNKFMCKVGVVTQALVNLMVQYLLCVQIFF